MNLNLGIIFGLLLLFLLSTILGVPVKTKSWKHRKGSATNFGELHSMKKRERRGDVLETKLLDVFGLREVPRHSRKQFETPPFMLELYQNLAGKEKSQHETKTGRKANTVRSFLDTGRGQENGFVFDLHGLLPRETILTAELHIYKKKDGADITSWESTDVNLYRVIESDLGREMRFIEKRTIKSNNKGWLVFDVTQSFLPHHGDVMAASFENTTVEFEFDEESEEYELKVLKNPSKRRERTPLLILYLNDTAIKHNDIITPVYMGLHGSEDTGVQDIEIHREGRRRQKRSSSVNRRSNKGKAKKCQLYEFYVDFQKVGWSDWIIAPNGYYANFCDGHCPFPLDPHFNATNHATVQAILHTRDFSHKGKRIPKPCCVPNEFESIHVLYLDDYNNVVLKEFDDMEAKSCGCH
ncbi:bone morphogenetic protein 2-like [Glandiceps talaboti]